MSSVTEQQTETPEPSGPLEVESPIINKAQDRRPASYYFRVPEHAERGRSARQQELFGGADVGQEEELALVNLLRQRVQAWREGTLTGRAYDGASTVTRELLALWKSQECMQRLFFAQIEAAETIIFLTEAAEPYRKGLLDIPRDEPAAKAKGLRAFTRYACKMATGTGKTTVMGMLSAWPILNRMAAPTDNRFSDTVLIVCPNVTIRERDQQRQRSVRQGGEDRRGRRGGQERGQAKEWRAQFRDQQVAFRLAREVCRRWQQENGKDAIPVLLLFPKVLFIAKRFLAEKLVRKDDSKVCDLLAVGHYMQAGVSALFDAVRKGRDFATRELPVIPQGASGRGSTLYVDFYSTKPIYPVEKCHLNAMVVDTGKWEQSAPLPSIPIPAC